MNRILESNKAPLHLKTCLFILMINYFRLQKSDLKCELFRTTNNSFQETVNK